MQRVHCPPNDLGYYDVTREPGCEVSVAAKNDTRKDFHVMIAQRIYKKAINRPKKAQKHAKFRDCSIENATEK